MMRRIATFAALITAAATTSVVLSGPASAVGITSSTITSPTSGAHYLISDLSAATTVTVTGTTTGGVAGDLVDVRCYEAPGKWQSWGPAIAVPIDGNGNFSMSMPTDMPYGTCALRAVPHGYSGSASLETFTGPTVTAEYNLSKKIPSGPNAGLVYNYYVELVSKYAMNEFHSAGSTGFNAARLQYADGRSSNYLWNADASLGNDLAGTRARLRADGSNAYGPSAALGLYPGAQDAPGLPALTFSAARNAATGVITIHEIDPIVVCPAGASYPPSAADCPQFSSAGVRLERTIVVDDDGLQVRISDVWRSTDGKPHTLSAHYGERISGNDSSSGTDTPTMVGLRMPWVSGAYQTYSGPTVLAGPVTVPATLFVRDEMAAPDGDKNHPRGAVTFDAAPSAIDRADYRSFNFNTEALTVPAGGTRLVRRAYVMGTSESVVAAKASANARLINPYRPDGSIKISGASAYVGNNVYSTLGTHETTTASRRRGTTATVLVRVQNDGSTADSFRLKAPGGSSSFSVHYYEGATGSKDITAAITAGTYRTSTLAPGATRSIRVVVTVRGAASAGTLKSWLVTATSVHDSTRRDAVKAAVRVAVG